MQSAEQRVGIAAGSRLSFARMAMASSTLDIACIIEMDLNGRRRGGEREGEGGGWLMNLD